MPNPDGFGTILHGWIDNGDTIAAELGIARADAATLYGAALANWGDETDSRLIGHYAAITLLPDGRLRLTRSPWTAPPLHYVNTPEKATASSALHAIFAAGHPRELDHEYVVDALAFDHRDGENCGWYKGVWKVPLGSVVVLGPTGTQLRQWYDPVAVTPVRLQRDEDYVEAADSLLAEAAGKALSTCRRPGLALSGGLDSPLVADALLRRMPETQRLPTFTFVPDSRWDGIVPPDLMGDEEPLVRAFAQMHPRLDIHFADPSEGGFDYRLRDLFAACDGTTLNVSNTGIFHGYWRMAKSVGCDSILTADLGNFTFSNDGDWSYSEHLRQGRWRQLYLTLRDRRGDPRPVWRKFLGLSVLPNMPGPLRRGLKALIAPQLYDPLALASLLTPAAREGQDRRRRARGGESVYLRRAYDATRAEWIRGAWASADSGEDLIVGFERLYGMTSRDVTAYRPLIEFCLGLPTDQFVKDGIERRLAKRMAAGRMPETQRLNPRYGRHNVDWHTRMTRRRAELKDYAERMRDHPFLGQVIDIDRMVALLDDWPEATPWTPEEEYPRRVGITRAVTVAQFVGYVEGRNDL